MNLWLIFLTGLTTGGLTCLALQGGLLATAIAAQRGTQDKSSRPSPAQPDERRDLSPNKSGVNRFLDPPVGGLRNDTYKVFLPTIIFLTAKISAYTFLGLLLGWFGSMFQLSILTQTIVQFVVGIFMIVTALRMLDVHPVFRRFVLTPPKAVFKFMRNNAKSGSYFSPLILGLATLFLPCGTTQAMEIQAVGTGHPLLGAATMLAFTLGTAPIFFIVGSVATKFSQTMEKYVYPVTATLVLLLGIMAIDNGLTLSGSSYTLKGTLVEFWETATGAPEVSTVAGVSTVNGDKQSATILIYATGYEPRQITLKSGLPTTLKLVTNRTQGCSRSITFPTLNIQKVLPETGTTEIELPALAKGQKVPFSCSMGMYSGQIVAS